jgi:regulator of replication initiation timing
MNYVRRTVCGFRRTWAVLIVAGAGQYLALLAVVCAAPGDWVTETIELGSREDAPSVRCRTLHGLIESQDDTWVNWIEIRQPPGKPTSLVIRPIERSAIVRITDLPPAGQQQLRRQIQQFIHRAEIEAGEMDAVRLDERNQGGVRHLLYQGKWFLLDSTLGEATTRYMAVKVQQMFTAYRQLLPPRTESRRPLRLMLFGSLDDYRGQLAQCGLKIDNPAVYLQEQNLVMAGGEMAALISKLDEYRAYHKKLLEEYRQLKETLPKQWEQLGRQLRDQGQQESQIRATLVFEKRKTEKMIQQKVDEIRLVQRKNERDFARAGQRMLSRLYHESFHAYLENYVYPHRDHDVPPWLNEGLAVAFEEGLLESGSLRLGAPNHAALACLKADLAGAAPLALDRLLASTARDFVVPEGLSGKSNRYYAYAWGLLSDLRAELAGHQGLGRVRRQGRRPRAARRPLRAVGRPAAGAARAAVAEVHRGFEVGPVCRTGRGIIVGCRGWLAQPCSTPCRTSQQWHPTLQCRQG